MFAIRQISTGYWMPNFPGRAGGTWLEPKKEAVPRLFRRHQDAKAALAWWLEGKVTSKYDFEGEFCDLLVEKVSERNSDDMEIVEVEIVERFQS